MTGPAIPRPRGRGRADLALVLTAAVWGSTFVIVQDGVEQIEPIPFLALRYTLASLVLTPFAWGPSRLPSRRAGRVVAVTPHLWTHGTVAGALLGAGYVFQTVGLQYTTSSASAFITYMLVIFVPVISAVTFRRLPHPLTALAILLAVPGLALLTGGASGTFGRGEIFTLGCAISFAGHIVVLSQVARRHDPLRLAWVQLSVISVACLPAGLFFGGYQLRAGAIAAAVFTAIFATALAFVLQTSAQRVVGPTRTAIILLLEPVFAAIFGYWAGERIGLGGVAGAGLILLAVLVAEIGPLVAARLPGRRRRRRKANGFIPGHRPAIDDG